MPPISPIFYRMAGAVALGAGLYGAGAAVADAAALGRAVSLSEAATRREDLHRDLAFLAISLPSLGLLAAARRFGGRSAGRIPGFANYQKEREEDLVQVVSTPDREEIGQFRNLENAYREALIAMFIVPTEVRQPFVDAQEGLARVQSALKDWENAREACEISEIARLIALARAELEFAVHLNLSSRTPDGEMHEKSGAMHLAVARNRIQHLRRTLNGPEASAMVDKRIERLADRLDAAIDLWAIVPEGGQSSQGFTARQEKMVRRAIETDSSKQDVDAGEAWIDASLAIRDFAYALRYEGRFEEWHEAMKRGAECLRRACRILSDLRTNGHPS